MELGKFIAKVISEIQSSIKLPNQILGKDNSVELDLVIEPGNDGKVSVRGIVPANIENVSRLKMKLFVNIT